MARTILFECHATTPPIMADSSSTLQRGLSTQRGVATKSIAVVRVAFQFVGVVWKIAGIETFSSCLRHAFPLIGMGMQVRTREKFHARRSCPLPRTSLANRGTLDRSGPRDSYHAGSRITFPGVGNLDICSVKHSIYTTLCTQSHYTATSVFTLSARHHITMSSSRIGRTCPTMGRITSKRLGIRTWG
jgi:hypothetical protein